MEAGILLGGLIRYLRVLDELVRAAVGSGAHSIQRLLVLVYKKNSDSKRIQTVLTVQSQEK